MDETAARETATPALRMAQVTVSFWLVAFLAMIVETGFRWGLKPVGWILAFAYLITLLGLWKRRLWAMHFSLWLAWFAVLMLWMFLVPMPDDDPSKMEGIKSWLYGMDTDIWRWAMVATVFGALASSILLLGQRRHFSS